MFADMISNKKLNQQLLIIRGRKLNISTVFIMQSYFATPKDVKLNYTISFGMKISNKQQLQQIAFNYSSDIANENDMNL